MLVSTRAFRIHTSRSVPKSPTSSPRLHIEKDLRARAVREDPGDRPKLGPTADRWKNSRSGIMRNQEWDPAAAELNTLDLAELVLGLLGLDAVDGEASLGVVDETEVLASLLDRNNVHEAGGVSRVGADLAVNLDKALHQDGLGLAAIEGVLEAVADEDDERQALALLVRTGRGLGGVGAAELVQQPVRRRSKALLVLLTVMVKRMLAF